MLSLVLGLVLGKRTIQCIKYYAIRFWFVWQTALGTSTMSAPHYHRRRNSPRDRPIGSRVSYTMCYIVLSGNLWTLSLHLRSLSLSLAYSTSVTQKAAQRNLCKRAKSTCSSIALVASTDGAPHILVGTHWVLGFECCM